VLGLVVCAVLAGDRSYVAIAEWAADADETTLAELGAGAAAPCESAFRRTLQNLDADALDDGVEVLQGALLLRPNPAPTDSVEGLAVGLRTRGFLARRRPRNACETST
jgi:hypothetical protein